MRIPLLTGFLKRLTGSRGGKLEMAELDLEAWVEKHSQTIASDLEKIWPHLPEDLVFVDVGANMGLFSEAILAGRPRARGYLFEPVAAMHALCRERFDGDERIALENIGLAHEAGPATIYKAPYNPGGNSVVECLMYDHRKNAKVPLEADLGKEEIRLEVFDDWARAKGLDFVHFIKTDTEGFDYRVLEGMLGFIEACEPKPVILSELLSEDFHPFWQDQLAVIERLYGMGYQEVDLAGLAKIQDVLFVPAGR